jgi:hypothetical protein
LCDVTSPLSVVGSFRTVHRGPVLEASQWGISAGDDPEHGGAGCFRAVHAKWSGIIVDSVGWLGVSTYHWMQRTGGGWGELGGGEAIAWR